MNKKIIYNNGKIQLTHGSKVKFIADEKLYFGTVIGQLGKQFIIKDGHWFFIDTEQILRKKSCIIK